MPFNEVHIIKIRNGMVGHQIPACQSNGDFGKLQRHGSTGKPFFGGKVFFYSCKQVNSPDAFWAQIFQGFSKFDWVKLVNFEWSVFLTNSKR